MTTIASRIATAIAIGMRTSSPSSRLDEPAATTKRISSVAYAVEEIASDEKTASAIVFVIRWCSCSAEESGLADQDPLDDGHDPRFVRSGR